MVDLTDYIDPPDDDDGETAAADFAALKGCLKALADAVASTNLAVLAAGHSEMGQATQRVQASVAALKRFADAFAVLDAQSSEEDEGDGTEGEFGDEPAIRFGSDEDDD